MKPILEVRNISKQYVIGGSQKRYLSFRESLIERVKGFTKKEQKEKFWALQDINFDVNPGDSIGIIGKNGAGKSTLLKIISRITPPTKGHIKARGRIASLLEVGTGFHPELTGRENIFLNGSILGLKKIEIQSKFDEIVDFSGVEKFLDTPLKHYSSGMQLRLAFSVAAHLEPEILIIDEVLAVGDAEFQKKCLGKMEAVSKNEGRTVLFVSHNMGAVKSLCKKSMLLEQGKNILFDDTHTVIENYFTPQTKSLEKENASLGKIVNTIRFFQENKETNNLYPNVETTIEIGFKTNEKLDNPVIGIVVRDFLNTPVIGVNNLHYGTVFKNNTIQSGKFIIKIKNLSLMVGNYTIDLFIGNHNKDIEIIQNATNFNIVDSISPLNSKKLDAKINKLIVNEIEWSINE